MKTSLTRKIKRREYENIMKANYGEIHELDSFYDNYLTMLYRNAEFDHTTEVEGIVNTLTNVLSVIAIGSGLFIISGGVFGFVVPGYVITAGQVEGGILIAKDIGHIMTGKDINGNPLSEVDKRAMISSLAKEGSMLAVSSFSRLKIKYTNKVDVIEVKPLDEAGNLKSNIKYKAEEYDYLYETDYMGRISKFETDSIQLTNRDNRIQHNPNTPGKLKVDHAGHLAGDRFGGSPELDNLVSQSAKVNLSEYKKLENEWAKAIEDGKHLKVNVEVKYDGDSLRPSRFSIEYKINGEVFLRITKLGGNYE